MPELPEQPPRAPPEPKVAFPEVTPAVEQINIVSARLRMSEERNAEMGKKLLLMEQNMLSNNKKAMNEIKSLQDEMNELKRTFKAVEDKIITIIKELRLTARKEDIDVMKRYVELWNPATFVRSEQVERIVEEKMGKHEEHEHGGASTEEQVERHSYDSPS